MPYFLQLARNTDQLLADMGWGLGVGSVDLKLPTLMVRTPFVFGVSLPYFTHTHLSLTLAPEANGWEMCRSSFRINVGP